MATELKSGALRPSKAPNLPNAPREGYDSTYLDQYSNILRLYFNQIDSFTQSASIPASGTTANRPVDSVQVPLQIGQYYFDTTIGRPIWWNGANWINAAGTVV
jgi:hypothetical protein